MASRMFQRLVQPIGTNVIEKSFTLSHYRGTRRKSCGCRILISVYKWHMKPFATKCRSVICIDFGSFYCAPGFPLRRAHLIITRTFDHNTDIFITGDWKFPMVMIGFGMFLLFDRRRGHWFDLLWDKASDWKHNHPYPLPADASSVQTPMSNH